MTNKTPAELKHPIQPLGLDVNGTLRFKENGIVRFLLDKGGFDLNQLSRMKFSKEDWTQFAQLIGYSLGGFGDLSYVDNETYETAAKSTEMSQDKARIEYLTERMVEMQEAVKGMRPFMAVLLDKPVEDLEPGTY